MGNRDNRGETIKNFISHSEQDWSVFYDIVEKDKQPGRKISKTYFNKRQQMVIKYIKQYPNSPNNTNIS